MIEVKHVLPQSCISSSSSVSRLFLMLLIQWLSSINRQVGGHIFPPVMCTLSTARCIINACPVVLVVPCLSNEPECEKVWFCKFTVQFTDDCVAGEETRLHTQVKRTEDVWTCVLTWKRKEELSRRSPQGIRIDYHDYYISFQTTDVLSV